MRVCGSVLGLSVEESSEDGRDGARDAAHCSPHLFLQRLIASGLRVQDARCTFFLLGKSLGLRMDLSALGGICGSSAAGGG